MGGTQTCFGRASKVSNPESALAVKNLPINNTTKINSELDKVNSAKFDVSKFAVANAHGSRIVELWNCYKEQIPTQGDDFKKLKAAVDGVESLMRNLKDQHETVNAHEVHECIKVRGDSALFLAFAIKPGTAPGSYHSIFCFVESDAETTPEQFTAFLINNGTVGYYAAGNQWMYMVDQGCPTAARLDEPVVLPEDSASQNGSSGSGNASASTRNDQSTSMQNASSTQQASAPWIHLQQQPE